MPRPALSRVPVALAFRGCVPGAKLGPGPHAPHPPPATPHARKQTAKGSATLRGAVIATVHQRHRVCFRLSAELGLLAAQPALGLGDLHSLDGAQPDQIGFEVRDHRQHVEPQPPDRIGGVANRAAQAQADLSGGEFVGDGPASGRDGPRRSSLVTFAVSPARRAARASRSPGRSRLVPVRPWSTYIRSTSTRERADRRVER